MAEGKNDKMAALVHLEGTFPIRNFIYEIQENRDRHLVMTSKTPAGDQLQTDVVIHCPKETEETKETKGSKSLAEQIASVVDLPSAKISISTTHQGETTVSVRDNLQEALGMERNALINAGQLEPTVPGRTPKGCRSPVPLSQLRKSSTPSH